MSKIKKENRKQKFGQLLTVGLILKFINSD